MPSVTHNGVNINYTDTGGDSPPVVLVHGFPLDGRMWEGQVQALSSRYRFIVPDLQGFGSSDAPEDRSSYSMDVFADEVKAVIDQCGVDKVVLGGLSMGGYVCLAFLRRHPETVGALALADTRAEPDPPEGKEKRTNQQAQVEAEGTSGLIDGLTAALLSETTKAEKPDVVERVKKLMDNPPAGYIGALEAMKNRPDSTEGLAKITVPTVVIVGEEDPLTPPSAARTLHEHIGASELVVIPTAGHLSNLEAEKEFNDALDRFLSKL